MKFPNSALSNQAIASMQQPNSAWILGKAETPTATVTFDPAIAFTVAADLAIPVALFFGNKFIQDSKYMYRWLWGLAFAINMYTVSLPGRFDSQVRKAGEDSPFFWKTLIAPAGYAFAIWGIIYLGEIILSSYVGLLGKPVDLLKRATPYWVAANLFQSIWCFVFRPRFFGSLWLPATQLVLAALSQSFTHLEFTNDLLASSDHLNTICLALQRFPITLHTGWLVAASLINLNSWATISKVSMGSQIAFTAASGYFAFAAGLLLTFWRKDPAVAFTIAWAIKAIAAQTRVSEVDVTVDVKEALSSTEDTLGNILIAFGVAQLGMSFFHKFGMK